MKLVNIEPRDYCNIAELICDRSQALGQEQLYTYLKDDLEFGGSLTYADLAAAVESLAGRLLTLANPGDRVLLLYPSGIDYITAFYACVSAGLIAVPVYAVQSPKDHQRLNAIALDSGAVLACTTQTLFESTAAWRDQLGQQHLQILCTDDGYHSDIFSLRDASVKWQDTAFLQYTSGSTGNPKGVMVTHGNLLHNASLILHGFGLERTDIGASWLPPYHDMGLIGGIIEPLFRAIPIYLISPMSFLKRPLRWLQVISKYGVTCTGGPNFAFDYCVKRVTEKHLADLALGSWSIAFNGAEPIRPETLKRFSEHFAPAGFRADAFLPCYGLAESTLFVSGEKRGRGAHYIQVEKNAFALGENLASAPVSHTPNASDSQQSLVSSGVLGVEQCAIIDPLNGRILEEGQIGEIAIASASVAKGYWRNDNATAETFQNTLENRQPYFMRTGDLGFFHQKQLVVTGRIKELIIINGRNLYPQDIEGSIRALDDRLQTGVTAVTASESGADGTESLIVFQELQRKDNDPDTLNAMGERIRIHLLQEFQINPEAVVLLSTSTIPKTTSGKIQRRKTLELYRDNALKILWQSSDSNPIATFKPAEQPKTQNNTRTHWEDLIENILRQYLPETTTILHDRPFQELGLDSKTVMAVIADLEDQLGYELSPTLVFAYPTIAELAVFLAGGKDVGISAPKVQPNDSARVSILGVACRFPGANSPAEFWQQLTEGTCAISEVPENRWQWQEHCERQGRPGYGQVRMGGFVTNIEHFDAEFFGISPKEARLMDPQQRILLEETWHALEDAGVAPQTLRGKNVGVYIGASESDYSRRVAQSASAISPWVGTGSALSILANRISYAFGFKGPSMTIDTACSSSLTAMHLALQGLQRGDCDWAVVGGVNLMVNPELNLIFSQAGMLAPDGLCKTFAENANGYVRAEGCGVVILRRTSDCDSCARQYAQVLSSAVNQDGQSNGLTAPNLQAQVEVIERALIAAQVTKSTIQAVECHGTGTELGDPIELSALNQVFGDQCETLRIGSVKTNIGHLEAAAGIAALIKTALSIYNKTYLPSLHCQQPTTKFAWQKSPLRVQQQLETAQGLMRIGVSGFGFGGTNAHIILQQAEPVAVTEHSIIELDFPVITVSARHPDSLNQLVGDYREQLLNHDQPNALALASQQLRGHLAYRCAWRVDRDPALTNTNSLFSRPSARLAWLFTGQGSQYSGMGYQTYQKHPTFRQVLDHCDAIFQKTYEFSLLDLLWGSESQQLHTTQFTQPALYAFEVAMASLWHSWGARADGFVGHSVGEYAAAYMAGVFSLEDGMILTIARGRLMQSLCEPGSMVSVWQSADTLTGLLSDFPDLQLAAFNSPTSQVVAGPTVQIRQFMELLTELAINHKELSVSHAFHSPSMTAMMERFREIANSIQYSLPHSPVYSAKSGAQSGDLANAEYWVDHVLQPVHFQSAIEDAERHGINTWLEVGPGQTLCGLTRQILEANDKHQYLISVLSTQNEMDRLIDSVVGLYNAGIDMNWAALNATDIKDVGTIDLPKYPFLATHHWLEKDDYTPNWKQSREFLGRRALQAPNTIVYEQIYNLIRPYSIAHHKILDRVLLSAANHISAYCELLNLETDVGVIYFENLEFCEPLFVSKHESYRIQYQWIPERGVAHAYATKNDKNWLNLSNTQIGTRTSMPAHAPPALPEKWDSAEQLYQRLHQSGYQYDVSFRWLTEWGTPAETSEWQSVARLKPPRDLDLQQRGLTFPPGWFDSLFHLCATLTANDDHQQIYLPIGIQGLSVRSSLVVQGGTVAVKINGEQGAREKIFSVAFWDEQGVCILYIEQLILKRVPTHWLNHQKSAALWDLKWISKPRTNLPSLPQETWQILVFNELHLNAIQAMPNNAYVKQNVSQYREGISLTSVDRLVVYVDASQNRQLLQGLWQLLQSLVQDRQHTLKEMVICSPNSLDSSDAPSDNALLLGWKRAFNNESFAIKVRLIDLYLEQFIANEWPLEILHETQETEVIVRPHNRLVPRLAPLSLNDRQRSLANSVLVTGATGDIGKRLVVHLAKNGVSDIVALSRTELSAKIQAEIGETGARLHFIKADITDREALNTAFDTLKTAEPIREIFHCAGVLKDGSFANLGWSDFEHTIAAKVDGAIHLYDLAQNHSALSSVTRWTLFSSIASLTGSMGQAHYAAANAFLDNLARTLEQQNVTVQCVNWGPWKGTSMVNSAQKSAYLRERAGLHSMEPQQAIDMLWRIPKTATQAFCGVVDVSQFGDFPGVQTTLFSQVISRQMPDQWTHFLERLSNSGKETRRELLLNVLIERTRQTLELPDDMEINPYKPLQEMGLDSVMAVELRNEVIKITGKSLPATLLFDYPTLAAIAEFLMTLLFPESVQPKAAPEATTSVTDDQLDALLTDMLED